MTKSKSLQTSSILQMTRKATLNLTENSINFLDCKFTYLFEGVTTQPQMCICSNANDHTTTTTSKQTLKKISKCWEKYAIKNFKTNVKCKMLTNLCQKWRRNAFNQSVCPNSNVITTLKSRGFNTKTYKLKFHNQRKTIINKKFFLSSK